jgi:U-box domain
MYVQQNDEFICPLTLTVMEDPVMTITGRSFERVAIMEWLARGNNTCPLSRQELHVYDLVTNHSLHAKIHKWKKQQQEHQTKVRKAEPESTTFTDDDSSSCFESYKEKYLTDETKMKHLPCFVSIPVTNARGVVQTGNNIVIQRRVKDMMNNQEQWDAFQQRVQEQLKKELEGVAAKRRKQSSTMLGCNVKRIWKGISNGTKK